MVNVDGGPQVGLPDLSWLKASLESTVKKGICESSSPSRFKSSSVSNRSGEGATMSKGAVNERKS